MLENIATVTVKGQVTIPKRVRDALRINEKDRLLFIVEDDRLVVIPLHGRPLSELRGALPATRPFPGSDAIREEVQRSLGERAGESREGDRREGGA